MQIRGFGIVTPVLPTCELGRAEAWFTGTATLSPIPRDDAPERGCNRGTDRSGINDTGAGGATVMNAEVDGAGKRVATLRGAGVEVDGRRAARALVAICLVALAVVTVVLVVAGINKNAQINRLRHHGVTVDVRVSGCLGLLGGSGSNGAGYACHGTFELGGRRYSVAVPGNTLYRPGATVRAVTDPTDPALLSTVAMVASERASWRVFVLPGCLLALLLALGGLVAERRRRQRRPRQRGSVGLAETEAS